MSNGCFDESYGWIGVGGNGGALAIQDHATPTPTSIATRIDGMPCFAELRRFAIAPATQTAVSTQNTARL